KQGDRGECSERADCNGKKTPARARSPQTQLISGSPSPLNGLPLPQLDRGECDGRFKPGESWMLLPPARARMLELHTPEGVGAIDVSTPVPFPQEPRNETPHEPDPADADSRAE